MKITSHIIIYLVFSFILHLSAAACSLPRFDLLQFSDFIFVFQRNNRAVSPHSGVPTHSITVIKPSGGGITPLSSLILILQPGPQDSLTADVSLFVRESFSCSSPGRNVTVCCPPDTARWEVIREISLRRQTLIKVSA